LNWVNEDVNAASDLDGVPVEGAELGQTFAVLVYGGGVGDTGGVVVLDKRLRQRVDTRYAKIRTKVG
jgi:hypothetical protein